MPKQLLLLEDDELLCDTLYELLEANGYDVDRFVNAHDAIDATYHRRYDLYILDINLPDMSGLELLESLRFAEDRTPAIFISAMVDINTIAKGFEVGAEDYIKKPFFPEELLIRIRAKFEQAGSLVHYGDLSFDPQSKVVMKGEEIIPLGEVQERLFELFMQNPGKVLDKSALLECLENPSESALRVALNKLKNTTGLKIKNIRSVGYVLERV